MVMHSMAWRKTAMKFLMVLMVALTVAGTDACTAILVGRKASATGRVIVSHNDDFRAGNIMRYAFLPRREGEKERF